MRYPGSTGRRRSSVRTTFCLAGCIALALVGWMPAPATAQLGPGRSLSPPYAPAPSAQERGLGAVPPPTQVPEAPSDAVPDARVPGVAPVPGTRPPGVMVPPPMSPYPGSVRARNPADGGPGEAEIATRLQALAANWAVLGARGPNYLSGVISLILNTGQLVLGGVLLNEGAPYDLIAPFFLVSGGIGLLRTVLVDFILPPDPQSMALEFATMPVTTRAERLARIEFGERKLEELAERALILRLVNSGLGVLGAGAVLGGYLALRPAGDFDPIEILYVLPPAVLALVSVVGLFGSSPAEQRWDAYRKMRDRFEARRRGRASIELTPLLAITPRGDAFAGVSARF